MNMGAGAWKREGVGGSVACRCNVTRRVGDGSGALDYGRDAEVWAGEMERMGWELDVEGGAW